MSQDWSGLQTGNIKPEVQKQITQLGLSYKLMTQFTSLVAVEERVVTTNGKPQRVEVPVEMPEAVSYEGIFGNDSDKASVAANGRNFKSLVALAPGVAAPVAVHGGPVMRMAPPPPMNAPNAGIASGSGGGIGSGSAAAVGSGGGTYSTQPPAVNRSSESADGSFDHFAPKPDTERALLESKLSPAVLARFDCWKKQQSNCKLATDGTLQIQLFLTDNSPAVLDQLKALGLQIAEVRKKEKTILGRLPIEKLTDLAKLETVKFVTQASR